MVSAIAFSRLLKKGDINISIILLRDIGYRPIEAISAITAEDYDKALRPKKYYIDEELRNILLERLYR